MTHFLFGLKRKKAETTLLIDVGTETVKALLFEEHSFVEPKARREKKLVSSSFSTLRCARVFEESGQKIKILGSSLEYFDRYGIFDSRDFETDVLKKAISRAIKNLGKGEEMNKSVILGLPAHILKARVIRQSLKREEPKKIIGDEDKSSSSPTEALDEVKKIAKKSFSSFVSSSAQRTKFSSPFDPARVRYYEIKK